MKKILSIAMLSSLLSLFIGCGGSGSDTSGGGADTPTNPTTSVTSPSNNLVIDNGRGTTNNQDTETAQD